MTTDVVTTEIEETKIRHNVALLGSETNGQLSLRVQDVAPGEGTPLHSHDVQSETFHVVRGSFLFQVDDKQVLGKPGFTVHIPAGVPHCFLYEESHQENGHLISVLTPGVHDGFIQNIPEAQAKGAPMEELKAMAALYGAQILGPKMTPKT